MKKEAKRPRNPEAEEHNSHTFIVLDFLVSRHLGILSLPDSCYDQHMKPSLLIVGLGNPGKNYAKTRHNLGFMAMDILGERFGQKDWEDKQKFTAQVCEARVSAIPVLLMKPQTFMNLSGPAIRKAVDFYKLNPKEQVLVVSDDIDLPLGTARLRMRGSAGTHNGLKSVVEQFGEEFPRLKLGIGPKPERVDLAAWVVSAIEDEEMTALRPIFEVLPETVTKFIMEHHNGED